VLYLSEFLVYEENEDTTITCTKIMQNLRPLTMMIRIILMLQKLKESITK